MPFGEREAEPRVELAPDSVQTLAGSQAPALVKEQFAVETHLTF